MLRKKPSFVVAGFAAAALMATAVMPAASAQDAPPDAPPADTAAEKVEFKIKLDKGQKLAFRQVVDMNQDMDMGGMQMAIVLEMSNEFTYHVTDVTEAGDMKIDMTFGRIKGSMENPMMGTIEFDSANPDGNPMSAAFTAQAGESLGLTLTSAGEVTEITGIEEMFEKMMAANPMAAAQMDSEGLSDQLKQTASSHIGMFPKEPVAVGESWTIEQSANQMGMDVSMKIDNTLKSATEDEAVVDATINASMSAEGNPMMAALDVETFKGTSTTTYSRKDGLVLSSSMTMNMKASMDAQGQQGSVDMVIETSIERIPVTASEEAPAAETPAEGGSDESNE